MSIYTKTGDKGSTGLFSGERVAKTHPRVAAYGTVDEMNSMLGVALAAVPAAEVAAAVERLQVLAFDLGSDLATVPDAAWKPRIGEEDVAWLESEIDRMVAELPKLRAFVLPGGSPAAAHLHVARTICRRAEREALHAATTEQIPPLALIFLNRLSDFLFVLARFENHLAGVDETEWRPKA